MREVMETGIEPALPRPATTATAPAERRGLARDGVRLLLSKGKRHDHHFFFELPRLLEAGDLLVVNRSATLAAALDAEAGFGAFLLHMCTSYGPRLWLTEPRWGPAAPGPLPLQVGQVIRVAGKRAKAVAVFPGIPRLWFVEFEGDPRGLMEAAGRPIRYGHFSEELPLAAYQTVFADRPGSAEMPSAGRPFTPDLTRELAQAGVRVVSITLHAGVSSLEVDDLTTGTLYPEPFEIDPATAAQLNRARTEQRRVIAVGTTVVRALASSWDGSRFRSARGMTSFFVRPGRVLPPLDGLISGFHEARGTHLTLLEAIAGKEVISDAYTSAARDGYLWHEFGDSHLILNGRSAT